MKLLFFLLSIIIFLNANANYKYKIICYNNEEYILKNKKLIKTGHKCKSEIIKFAY